jgi:catalase
MRKPLFSGDGVPLVHQDDGAAYEDFDHPGAVWAMLVPEEQEKLVEAITQRVVDKLSKPSIIKMETHLR